MLPAPVRSGLVLRSFHGPGLPLLRGAGAEIVVTNLSDVATGALANGRLEIAA